MTYVKFNVPKPGNNKGVGGNKKDKITLIDLNDIAIFPQRDDKGILITDNIIMKEGAYAIWVYATTTSIKGNQGPEGEKDAVGMVPELEFSHPGNDLEIEEMLANWMNRDIIAIYETCSDNRKILYGTPCAPLQMHVTSEDSKDMNKSTITLKSEQKSMFRAAFYEGTITYADVAGTADADATSVDVTAGGGEYQLTDGSASPVTITSLDNAVNGKSYTLLGSGGSNPSVIDDSGDFILSNGNTWTAIAGSQITFKAFKDGTSTFKFIELSRN